ncbi:MAG: magnesium transporter CorA family protein [Ignavibacteria bacterium]|nr:magnesium transporter CorA family protein [Ignavibacteria bacterium]
MITKFKIINDRLVECEDGNLMFMTDLSDDERRLLTENFLIDEHTLTSSLDPDELARLEVEPQHFAFIIKAPKHHIAADSLIFRVQSIGIFLFLDKMVVVSQDPLTDLLLTKPFNRVTSIKDVFFKVIYSFIAQFYSHLNTINKISDELERKLSQAQENKYLLQLFELEKSLVYYSNAITTNQFLLEKIRFNANKLNITEEERELLEDIIIENNQCLRQAETYSSILASLMDARASIIANNLNVLMKTLNIIMITIMVPTFVVSLFSMNVPLPLSQELHTSFWIILLMCAVAAICFVILWNIRVRRLR